MNEGVITIWFLIKTNLLWIAMQNYINKLMSSFVPFPSTLGLAFSIGGLALSPFVSYFMRMYSQSLLVVQLVYLFASVYAPTTTLFANNLNTSWLGFVPSILTYCPAGSAYECNNASLITPLVIWAAIVFLVWFIVKLVAIKKPNASFKPFYNFFRGFFRCTAIPLIYNTFNIFILSLQNQDYHRDYYAAVIILIFHGLVMLIELIAYKCSEVEGEDSWSKWIQFWSQLRVGVLALLVSLSYMSTKTTKYVLYAPFVLYDIFHLVKYNTSFKVFERVVFILQESILITIYSMFIFDADHIRQYNLDFIAVAAIILLQLLQLMLRIYSYCKLNGSGSGLIKNQNSYSLEKSKSTLTKEKSGKLSTLVKQSSIENLDDSIAELKDSTSSPRKRGRGRLL